MARIMYLFPYARCRVFKLSGLGHCLPYQTTQGIGVVAISAMAIRMYIDALPYKLMRDG